MSKTSRNLVAGLVVVGLTLVLVWAFLPRGLFSDDLTRIGQGAPAVVLVFENHTSPSMETVDYLQRIREDYGDRVEFLVANIGAPQGRQLAALHDAPAGTVLVFDARGQLQGRSRGARSSEALRSELQPWLDHGQTDPAS